jgi:hypothetical protein
MTDPALKASDELRDIITAFYEHGTPLGARLEALLVRVEALEAAACSCGKTDEPSR